MAMLGGLFESRRFWAALGGLLLVVTQHFGLPIDQEQVQFVVMLIASWIVGDSLHKTKPKGINDTTYRGV